MPKYQAARIALVLPALLCTTALAGEKAAVTLSNVTVEFKGGLRSDGKQYPRISLDVLINKKPSKGTGLTCKAKCQVGEKKMSDTGLAMEKWDELDEGETKRVEMAPFVTQPLDATPSNCEFSVRWGRLFGGDPKEVGKFCWTPEGVKDGACPKPK